MQTSPLKRNERFTYRDYLDWPDDERWELIDGIAYAMSPAPSRRHQDISTNLMGLLYNYFKDKPCRLYAAPFDVRIPLGEKADEDISNVIQPDISIICDEKKLDDKGCLGAPDLIVEIISPATAVKDKREKLFLYEKAGVKEYWVVHPGENILEIFSPDDKGLYGKPEIFSAEDQVTVKLFPGLRISLGEIFAVEGTTPGKSPGR